MPLLHSLPIDQILDQSKFKELADNRIDATEKLKFVRIENIVGKEENACYKHFLLFTQCFPKASDKGLLKVGIV